MNDLAKSIINSHLKATRLILQNNFSDIVDVKLCWHNLNFIYFSLVNYSKLSKLSSKPEPKVLGRLDYMLNLGLLPDSVFLFYQNNELLIEQVMISLIEQSFDKVERFDLSMLHDYLMSYELLISPSNLEVKVGKKIRDITGTYYTPSNLADRIVTDIFENNKNAWSIQNLSLSESIKIVDFSCGGGEFFWSVQKYLEKNYNIPKYISSKFFWGVDVNPIALQLTICKLLIEVHSEDWKLVISHFKFGNPLISVENESDYSEKNSLYACGRLYANGMGINFKKYIPKTKFDLVIGNPPWEKIRFEERKFFGNVDEGISMIHQKNTRRKKIDNLRNNWKEVYALVYELINDYQNFSSKRFKHPYIRFSINGELNTYALFTELGLELTNSNGICSLIVKSSLVTSPINARFWNKLVNDGNVKSLFMFSNVNKIFKIDSREKFTVLMLTHAAQMTMLFAAGLDKPDDFDNISKLKISKNELNIINPKTGMIPNVSRTSDIQVLLLAHDQLEYFDIVFPNCHFGRVVHFTTHSAFIDTESSYDNIPIYEGKFIEQYDARFSTFRGLEDSRKYSPKATALKNEFTGSFKELPESRYFLKREMWCKLAKQYSKQFSLCWRSLTSSTNSRTTLAMILPTCPTSQSIQFLQNENDTELLLLLGLFNSIPFDYFVRLKMPGLDLTQSVIKQIPVPKISAFMNIVDFNGIKASLEAHIITRLYFILQNEPLLDLLLRAVNYPIYSLSEKTASISSVRKELDLLFSKAYGFSPELYDKVLRTFPKY